ncbi:MAG TPA: isochorismatase family protein [Blastocatellia bacterium]|nr:isochorismatase family protein [Blastocatellia bacterium]
MPHIGHLSRENSALIVVDMQEAFRPVIQDFAEVASRIGKAVQGAQLLGVPIIVTEQYPRGLRHTAEEITRHLPPTSNIVEKMCFSSCGVEEFQSLLISHNVRQALVCGIEAHICVTQTVLDLLAGGIDVHLLVDCITARKRESIEVALARLTRAGAGQSNIEMALFEMLRGADTPQFKAVQSLIK